MNYDLLRERISGDIDEAEKRDLGADWLQREFKATLNLME